MTDPFKRRPVGKKIYRPCNAQGLFCLVLKKFWQFVKNKSINRLNKNLVSWAWENFFPFLQAFSGFL
jgi:hypothetical protein